MDGLIFIYLISFPFGKLIGIVPDLIVFLIFLFSLKSNWKKTNTFLVVCIFSLVLSLIFFNLGQIWTGVFYLLRLMSYFALATIAKEKFVTVKRKDLLVNSLIAIGFFIAIFGIIQYLFFPDLRALKAFGWDDHYFRLVSSFLDPAFTGILLVMTQILYLSKTIRKLKLRNILLNLFLIICILLTYSRASFLALFIALVFLFIKMRKKIILVFAFIFVISIPFLPKAPSEGTNLLRTYSINQKLININEGVELIKNSPIFGLGFNNICQAKLKFGLENNANSHTCSGLDNSILFIIATTGFVGLSVFIQLITNIIKNTKKNYIGIALFSILLAVFIHGMFTNTFFYNFVLGYLAILIGVTRKIKD